MKLLRDLGFLRSLRGLLLSGRRDAARTPRTVTVPAPLNPSAHAPVVELRAQDIRQLPRPADMAAARSAAAARASRAPHKDAPQWSLQTQRNKVLLSRQA